MGFWVLFIMTIFDMTSILLFVHSIHREFKTKLMDKLIFLVIISFAVAGLNVIFSDDVFIHLLSGIAALITLFAYFVKNGEKNRSVILLLYFICVLFTLLIQLSMVVIVNAVIGDFVLDFKHGMIFQAMSMAVVLLCVKYLPLSNLFQYITDNNRPFRIIITSSFMVHYGISILWFMDMRNVFQAITSTVSIIIFAIIINVLLIQDGMLSKAYRDRVELYDTYFPIIDDMVNELRQNQHDYHNHIQTIIALKESGTMEDELKDYIEEIEGNSIWTKLLKMENRILAAFLYSKMKEAEKHGIKLVYHINNYDMNSCCTEHELIEMYGILLDNAIEAVNRLKFDVEMKRIQVELKRNEHLNSIRVTNPGNYISTNDINHFFKKGFTTKKNSRGIGLSKVKEMVEKNKGSISFYYDTVNQNVVAEISHC